MSTTIVRKTVAVMFGGRSLEHDVSVVSGLQILHALDPERVAPMPIYIDQQTDVSGCVRYGSGTLVSSYFTWAAVRRQHPKRYEEASGKHLDAIVRALTESTCACSDRASVEQELTEFLRRADATDVRTRVEARLAAVRSGGADMRFRCHSG